MATQRFEQGLAACAILGASAALCEVLRAAAAPDALSPAYAAWCALLIIGGSVIVGLLTAPLARKFPALMFVAWLAAAGTLVHGAIGGVAFALAGFAVGWFARKSVPRMIPWAASIGVLFELSGSHANRFTSLIDSGVLTSDQLALLQQLVAFTLTCLFVTWLLGRERARAAMLSSTLAVIITGAAFSAHDLLARAPRTTSTLSAHAGAAVLRDRPSILLLVLDTVRADHLSIYGYARKTTPQLERILAAHPSAQRFSSAYANGSWTVPSHASLLSGQLVSVHGADFVGTKAGEALAVAIAPEVPMLAELLAKQGWATFGVFANRWLRSAPGFRRGFESFERVEPRVEVSPLGEILRKRLVPGLRAGDMCSYPSAELVSAKLLARLDEVGAAPFFGLANFMDAHGPHVAVSDVAGSFGPWSVFDDSPQVLLANSRQTNQRLMNRYDEQILHLDRELGLLFDELEQRGILERSWVIVIGDHGEAFGEHGVTDHGTAVFDEIVHVPLLVFPPRDTQLAKNSGPVSQVDVAATIAAIAAAPYQGPGRDLREVHGDSLVQIQHGAAPFRSADCGEIAGADARAVIRGKWKLLDQGGAQQLFDLESDPEEAHDLSREDPQIVADLRARLPQRMLHATPVDKGLVPTATEQRRLHGLGY